MVFFIHRGNWYRLFNWWRALSIFMLRSFFCCSSQRQTKVVVMKLSKHEKWNVSSQKCQIKIPRDGKWLFGSKHTFVDVVVVTEKFFRYYYYLLETVFKTTRKVCCDLKKFFLLVYSVFICQFSDSISCGWRTSRPYSIKPGRKSLCQNEERKRIEGQASCK